MHPTDRAILEHCVSDYQPIVPLNGRIPSGTLYRHVARLVKLGWLDKQGALYRATEAVPPGRRGQRRDGTLTSTPTGRSGRSPAYCARGDQLWQRRGGRVDDAVGKLFADGVKREVVAVLQRFLRHAGAS